MFGPGDASRAARLGAAADYTYVDESDAAVTESTSTMNSLPELTPRHSEADLAATRARAEGPLPGWSVVDLFCGIGGLSHGLRQAGLPVAAGVDADPTCRYAFEANNEADFIGEPLEEVTGARIRSMYPEGSRRILVGCAPCTPFSAYAHAAKRPSDKWSLVDLFLRRIEEVDPEIVSMENVPRLKSFRGGGVFRRFVNGLERLGFRVVTRTVDAADFGVAQHRRRLVVLASRLGEIRFAPPSRPRRQTVRDAIGHQPPIRAGEAHPDDTVHRAPNLSPINLRRIRAAKPGRPWTEWEAPDLIARCHRRSTGASYKNVYGRMEWDRPAPTLTTGCFSFGRGRFGHPEQDRAISLREAALLQSFPAGYRLAERGAPVVFSHLGRHLGNAVPVALGAAIGRAIRGHVEEVTA